MKLKVIIFLSFVSIQIKAQLIPNSFEYKNLNSTFQISNSPLSNSITDIVTQGDTIWLATSKGLSRSTDKGISWKNFYGDSVFQTESISAIAILGKTIWVATAHSEKINSDYLPVGSGLKFSIDGGASWNKISQPIDTLNVDTLKYGNNKIRALGITTLINNITYDIAISNSTVWIASFAGMARKSSDNGKTWQRVILPPDNLNSISPSNILNFDLSPTKGGLGLSENLNHRVFSVHAQSENIIWFGTAGGINKSVDGGISWTKYTFNNQVQSISGNFVVAINSNKKNKSVWAVTINALDPLEDRGISFTNDSGKTWQKTLLGNFAHNIGFMDSIIYVPTDNGIYRSLDAINWYSPGFIQNPESNQKYTSTKFYSAATVNNEVFIGGNDGLISTSDSKTNPFGLNWKFFRASPILKTEQSTFSYPNPFSPNYEVVRLRYSINSGNNSVTIRIFDFGMNLVTTLIQNATRVSSSSNFLRDEIWNGKTETGNLVANGIYFYQIIINNNQTLWGKILVIQ